MAAGVLAPTEVGLTIRSTEIRPQNAALFAAIERAFKSKPCPSDEQMRAQQQRTKVAHTRYLQHHILLEEIQNLTLDSPNGPSGSLTESLRRHAEVARAAQELPLQHTNGSCMGLIAASSGNMQSAEESEAGSTAHYVGVTPQQLLGQQLPQDRAAVQKAHASAIPLIEARLHSRVAHVTRCLNAPQGPGQGHAWKDGPSPLAQHIAARAERTRARDASLPSLLASLLTSAAAMLTCTADMHDKVVTFARQRLVDRQQALDQFDVELGGMYGASLMSKLQQTEWQLKFTTYNNIETIAALKHVHARLKCDTETLQAAHDKATAALATYRALGTAFTSVVEQYDHVSRQLASVQESLRMFASLEQDLMHVAQ